MATVRDGGTPTVPGEFGLQVVRLTETAYRAQESGRTIQIESGTVDRT